MFDRGSDILAHRLRLARANRRPDGFTSVWARPSDGGQDARDRLEAEDLLAVVASYATWGECLWSDLLDSVDAAVREAFMADEARGHPINPNQPHPLVTAELDFWATMAMPKDQRANGPRHFGKPDVYDDEMAIPAVWALLVARVPRS